MRLFILLLILSFADVCIAEDQFADRVKKLIEQYNGEACYWDEYGELYGWFGRFSVRNYKQNCRIDAAAMLGKLGQKAGSAVPILVKQLAEGPNDINTGDGILPFRSETALALGRIGNSAAIPALMKALEDNSPASVMEGSTLAERHNRDTVNIAHKAIVEALGMFGAEAKAAVPLIIPVLSYRGRRHSIKYAPASAARALGAIGDPRAIPALKKAFNEGSCEQTLCRAASESLKRLGS